MDDVIRFVKNSSIQKMLIPVAIIIVTLIISRVLKAIIYKRINDNKSINDNKRYYPIKKTINYITGIIIAGVIISILLESAAQLATYVGLVSAGVAIALKEIFMNIAGWLLIEIRKPFDVGHRILIGDQKGDVIDKRLFQFSLIEVSSYEEGEQSTGRIIDIPNSFVFVHPTVNYTKGFEYIWNEIRILLTFDSDWKKAKKLLLQIATKDTEELTKSVSKQMKHASKTYMIQYNKLTPIVYTDVKESGIQLTVRYLCEPKQRRTTSNAMWEEVLDMIDRNEEIKLAYATK